MLHGNLEDYDCPSEPTVGMPCQQWDLLSELNQEAQTWGACRESGLEKAKPGGMETTKNYVHAKYNCF